MMRSEGHSKVWTTTLNMTPARAVTGIALIAGYAASSTKRRNRPATTDEMRVVAPDCTLIIAWPIIAQPPMPPSTPHTTLASPCPKTSRFGLPLVCVSSSTSVSVMRLSSTPTRAMTVETGRTVSSVLLLSGGIEYSSSNHTGTGSVPRTDAKSLTTCVRAPKGRTTAHSSVVASTIATSDEGTRFVRRGRSRHVANETSVSTAEHSASVPPIHPPPSKAPKAPPLSLRWASSSPPWSARLNNENCARPITIARPLQNPIMTGCGMRRTSLSARSTPSASWSAPITITAQNKYSMPFT